MQHKKRLIRVLTFTTLAFGTWGVTPMMEAQEAMAQDWNVEGGNKRKAEIIRRYKKLLESRPTEGLFFNKLLQETGKGAGLDALIKEYQGKAKASPKTLKYWLISGHLLKAKARYAEAFAAYDEAVKLDATNPLGYLGRGSTALMINKNKDAEADFERALALEKNKEKKQQILRKLADIAFAQRDWDAAQKYYDRLIVLQPRNQYLRMEYAQVLVKYKRYPKALEQYEALVKLAGRNVKARATTLRDMADLYERMGEDTKALDTYKKAMSYVKPGNWLYREVQQRIIGVYRRADKLQEFVDDRIKTWRRPNYDQAMMLAGIYDELGKEEKALDFYKKASSKNRRAVDPRVKVIQILSRRGDMKSVIKNYKSLIGVAPTLWRFRFDLAKIYYRNGERKNTISTLDGIKRRFKRDPDAMITLADMYMRLAMKDRALSVYKSLVSSYPRNDGFIVSLGEYYYQSGEVEKAIKTWKKVLKSDLSKSESYAKLGHVLVEHNMIDRGISYYEQAKKLAPKDAEVLRGLAIAYESARRWEQAISAWNMIVKLENQQPQALTEARSKIIKLYQKQSRLRPMMRTYEARFEAKPPDIDAGYFLAEAHMKLKEGKKAEAIYQKIIEADGKVDKQDIQALIALEKAYSSRDENKKAIEVLEKLSKLRPLRAKEYYYRIAELSLKNYEDDKAIAYAKLALEKNPDDATSHAQLADVYAKMKQTDKAIASYRTSIELDPREFKNYMALAQLLLDKEDNTGALKLYREIAQKAYDEQMVLTAARKSMSLAVTYEEMEQLEADLIPLVFKTPPKPVYRKIALELYGRMISPLVTARRYGTALNPKQSRRISAISARSYPVLIDALQSPDVGHRQISARMLADLGQSNAAATLARMVADKREPLRMQAAVSTARLGDPRASAILARALKDKDRNIRAIALWSLGASGGKDAVKPLVELINQGGDVSQRTLAAIGLGRSGEASAAKASRKMLVRYKDSAYSDQVSAALLWSLGQLKDTEGIATLENALGYGNLTAKFSAADALAHINNAASFKVLLASYWSGDEVQRQAARTGLMKMASMQSSDVLVNKKFEQVNREANFFDARSQRMNTQDIWSLFEEEIRSTPVASTEALILKHKNIVGQVIKEKMKASGLTSRPQVLRDVADIATVLGLSDAPANSALIGARKAWLATNHSSLQEVLSKGTPEGIVSVLPLVALIADPRDVSSLNALSTHKQVDLRVKVIEAMVQGYSSDSSTAQVVLKGLADDHFMVRATAAKASKSLAHQADIEQAVAGLIQDPFSAVRMHAFDALSSAKSSDATTALLIARLPKERADALVALVSALKAIGSASALKAIEPLKQSPNLAVRRAAGAS